MKDTLLTDETMELIAKLWPTSTAMKSSTAIRSVTTTRLISMKSSPSSSSRTQSFEIKRAGSTDTP